MVSHTLFRAKRKTLELSVYFKLLSMLLFMSLFRTQVNCLNVVVPAAFRDARLSFRYSFGGPDFSDARTVIANDSHVINVVDSFNTSTLQDQDVLFTGALSQLNEQDDILEWVSAGHVAYLMCGEPDHSYCGAIPGITPSSCVWGPCYNLDNQLFIPTPRHQIVAGLSATPEFESNRVRFDIQNFPGESTVVATYRSNLAHPAIVDVAWGKGRVILIGDASAFTNSHMSDEPQMLEMLTNVLKYAEEIINTTTTVAPTDVPTDAPTGDPKNIGLAITSDILIVEPTQISGNLSITNSTVTVSDDIIITVSGCLETKDGILRIKINDPPKDGEKRDFLEYNCLTSEFATIHTLSDDACKDVTIASSEYSPTTLSVIFSVKDVCQGSQSSGGLQWWGILIIVIVVILIAVVVTLVVYYVKPLRIRFMPYKRPKTTHAREVDIEITN
mmetsp:Transcript_24582/g.27343  ORF Transcript_24582/g.27343 Transcript_24582/m.27343 type:complete len:444 (-) Transcript_24582:47-1378(-)